MVHMDRFWDQTIEHCHATDSDGILCRAAASIRHASALDRACSKFTKADYNIGYCQRSAHITDTP